MDSCSNQTVWKLLTGHASQRSSEVVFNEVSSCVQRLKEGLAYYDKKPCKASDARLKNVLKVKGARLHFILEMSRQLDLDQVLCFELFQSYLTDAYHGSLEALNKKLADEKECQKLLAQLESYLLLERRHLLRCVKHLYGFWQDPSHPDREVYERCIDLLDREHSYIEAVLNQFERCAKSTPPPSIRTKEGQEAWQLCNLSEQAELLEIVLLYHKDYYHPPQQLLEVAKLFQEHGFSVGLFHSLPSAEVLVTHISNLCALILVEGLDLEFVQHYQDDPDQYSLNNHLLLKVENKKILEELDGLFMSWGDLRQHTPVLLAWTLFRFVAQPDGDIESLRCLGKKALESGVFGYLNNLLNSPFFAGDMPVSMTVRSLVHVLLSMCVTGFREDSLGDVKVLISIATKCFDNPLHRLEFWGKRIEIGAESGTGLLLASALRRFPLNLSLVLGLLEPLAQDESCSHSAFEYLSHLGLYACEFASVPPSSVEAAGDSDQEWRIVRPLQFYTRESQHLGLPKFVLDVGTVGVVLSLEEDGLPQVICWPHHYSAWHLFALITASINFTPGIGIEPVQSAIVEDVLQIARLVTVVIRHNWALAPGLTRITQQYYHLLQKFSSLPHPPSLLLAECVKCLSVMAANDPKEVWLQLGHTSFLPHINYTGTSTESISIAPGYYGDLMNSWERPRGIYPISMAMLDLLLAGFPPGDCRDMLACVVLVMREMFAGSHSWRYRHSTNRDQIGHKLLLLCYRILSREEDDKSSKGSDKGLNCTVGSFVRHFLLYSVGGHSLLGTLALSLEIVNIQYATRLSVYSEVLQVEALTLAFDVIDLLLQGKTDQNPTPLEQTLATQSLKRKTGGTRSVSTPVHLVAVIASYIHHHDNPKVPAGATKLLTRLSQVSRMSVYACLGTEAVAVRDAYIHRLRSRLEETDLKVAILELVIACVTSQPGMMELFLNIQTDSSSGEMKYSLGNDSVLRVAMEIITVKEPAVAPELRAVALKLLRSLWMGRHDAALIALRAEKNFWTNITEPLFNSKQNHSAVDYLIPSHVMCIVAMEMYYIMRNRLDKELKDTLAKFSSDGGYKTWSKRLRGSPTSCESEVEAQLELSRAWSTFICVGAFQEMLFHLTSQDLHKAILEDTLGSLLSHLDMATTAVVSPSNGVVSIAMELSMLSMVLMNKWVMELGTVCRSEMAEVLAMILDALSHLKSSFSVDLLLHVYASLLKLLLSFATRNEILEPERLLNLIPFLEDTFKYHSQYSKMNLKQRPDVLAVHVLTEVLHCTFISDSNSLCLEVLSRHSVITMVMAQLEEDLHLTSDLDYVLAVLNMLITMASTKSGAEYLLSNRIHHHINVTLASALTLNKDWGGAWPKGLQLTTNLLHALSHQYLSHALDFVGVYQEKLMLAVDIFHVVRDLRCLEETQRSCQFLCHLSLYQRQWQFAMPLLHSDLVERLVVLMGAVVAVTGDSRSSTLKQIVMTMDAAGVLAPEEGPLGALASSRGGREKKHRRASGGKEESSVTWLHDSSVIDTDEWVVSCPAYSRLQDGLVSILTSCLSTIRHYSVPLGPRIMEGGMDILDYPPLFTLSLAPPSVQPTTPPSLGTLTSCLSTGLFLMKKLDPPHSGTPTRTPSRSPIKSPPGTQPQPQTQSRVEVLSLLEQTVVVLLAQTSRYLADPSVLHHDKLKLKKELANELRNFSNELLRSLKRRIAASPGVIRTTPPSRSHTHSSMSLQDSFSSGRATSLTFSNTSEQGIFKLALSFSKQFFE